MSHVGFSPTWTKVVLLLAGIYNIAWGSLVSVFPRDLLAMAGLQVADDLAVLLFQCIGMMIAVFGAAYLAAAHHPLRYWPVVFAGLIGRILGPIGFFVAAMHGTVSWKSGITIITNDLIWLPFFASILYLCYQRSKVCLAE